jgi:hypothetical protein
MPFDCQHRARFGHDACMTDCPTARDLPTFHYARVERPGDVPAGDPAVVDLALLDMHHGWPNLGHDALVHALQNAVCDISEDLAEAALGVRVVSYDVRRGLAIPEPPGGRYGLYMGTGGPGHLDPALNDGSTSASQGIREDPSWEAPLFRLFEAIRGSQDAALFGVCHTFGVMCRWLGVADVVVRGPAKGGKSAGIVENLLTDEAAAHPWFSRLSWRLPDGRRLRVLDNRLFDLVPRGRLPAGLTPIGYETLGVGGPQGEGLTMLEVARDRAGVMPRIFGVNHHPEIVNRPRQVHILRKKLERGDVAPEWYAERMRTLTEPIADDWGDRLLHLTSSYTLMAPLRFHLYRLVRERAEALGRRLAVDEATLPLAYNLAIDSLTSPRHTPAR